MTPTEGMNMDCERSEQIIRAALILAANKKGER